MANGRRINQLLIPGGFRASTEQTAATQALLINNGRAPRARTTKKRRKKTATRKKSAPAVRKNSGRGRAKKSKKPARLVKGSIAAKRHMAKLRRMQGKR